MKKTLLQLLLILVTNNTFSQLKWHLVDSVNSGLPKGVKLYRTSDSIGGKPNIAYYIEANLKDNELVFDVDTTYKRRLTPNEFYIKNEKPLVVVNGTFFSFKTNQNLNTVIKNGKNVAFNVPTVRAAGKDSLKQLNLYRSAIGINKHHKADVAWINTDTTYKTILASEEPIKPFIKTDTTINLKALKKKYFKKWKMQTAIGGGPVLLQNGQINISYKEEIMFTGKGFDDKHPRTAMGYTKDDKLIILVVQGRFPNKADGVSLTQEAQILKDLGCIEALNLDGGGSSCMLVNGKETITPSDKTGQRALPAVFIIKKK
jgi:Phosphodiester glycosidase